MMNKYTSIMIGAACLLAASCHADTVRREPVRNTAPASSVQASSAAPQSGHQNDGVQEHRRFKRLSLPLR
ncbi:hypothetical protein HHJ06_03450 [Akkermansia muciniphila]|nr:hypothetical protein [Akkermansia muciniphila]